MSYLIFLKCVLYIISINQIYVLTYLIAFNLLKICSYILVLNFQNYFPVKNHLSKLNWYILSLSSRCAIFVLINICCCRGCVLSQILLKKREIMFNPIAMTGTCTCHIGCTKSLNTIILMLPNHKVSPIKHSKNYY